MNKTHSYIALLLFCLSLFFSAASAADRSYGPVKNNDFLSKIVVKSYPNSALTRDQLMIGILRANYESFRGGNVHFLKVGENLTLPDEDVVRLIDKDEAARTVEEHLRFFKRGKTGTFPATPLPTVAKTEATEIAVNDAVDIAGDSTDKEVASDVDDSVQDNSKVEDEDLEPVKHSVAEAEKETKENQSKLESLESEKVQQDEVLQSLEMQIKKLEDELQANATQEKKEEDTSVSPKVREITEETETVAQDESNALENATINSLENNASVDIEDEVSVKEADSEEAVETKPSSEAADVVDPPPPSTDPVETSTEKTAEEPKSTAAEEEVFVKETEEESEAVSDKIVETIESSTEPPSEMNIPWWVWIIPLFLIPLLVLGLALKSKGRVSSTNLPSIKKPQKEAAPKKSLRVDASEPVIKTSSTVVEESSDVYEEQASQVSQESLTASEQEVSLKIDMARAYLDMDYHDAAVEILKEVLSEGNAAQVEKAREILARI